MSKTYRTLVVFMLALLGGLSAQAAQCWWSGNGTTPGGSGTWNTTSTTNWSSSPAGPFNMAWPNTGSDEAIFTNTSGSTVTLSGTIRVGVLTIYTNNLTFNGGLLDFGSSVGTINLPDTPPGSPASARHQAIFNSPLSGSGGLNVISAGGPSTSYGFDLKGNNSGLSGKLEVQGAVGKTTSLFVTNDFNFGAVPAVYTPDALTFTGGSGEFDGGSFTISSNRGITVSGPVLNFYQGGPYIVNSRITGSGGVTLAGSGVLGPTVAFNQTNDFAGDLLIGSSGKAILGVHNALPHGAGKGNVKFNYAGYLDLNGYNLTLNGFGRVNYGDAVVRNTGATSVTLTVGDNDTTSTLDGVITNGASSGALSVEKIGTGTTTLKAYTANVTANAYSGTTTVRGGALVFDRTNWLNEALAGDVRLAGGTLSVLGSVAATSATQTFGNVTLNSGGSGLTVANRGGTATLTLGNTWTRYSGASLLVTLLPGAGGATLSSSPTLTNGILGYAFVQDATGLDFATVSGGNIVRYTNATHLVDASGDLNSTVNYYIDADNTLTGPATTQTVNSLRFNHANLTNTAKVLVIGSGGMIFSNGVGNVGRVVKGGTITAGGGDLVVCPLTTHYSSTFFNTIDSAIADNGHSVGFTLAGGGELALGTNFNSTYTGDTVVNQGLLVYLRIPHGPGKGNLLVNYGGVADVGVASAVVNGLSQSPGNAGGEVKTAPRAVSTFSLAVGDGDASASFAGKIWEYSTSYLTLIKIGTGTQTLTGVSNTYRGGTILSNGVLCISSLSNIGGANAAVTFAGGTLRITGTALTGFGVAPVTVAGNVGLDIADVGNTFSFTNDVPGILTKRGSGNLLVSGAVNMLVTDVAGTVSTNGGGSVLAWTVKSLSGGAYAVNGNEAIPGDLTLEGSYLFNVGMDSFSATGHVNLKAVVVTLENPGALTPAYHGYVLAAAGPGKTLSVSGTAPTATNLPERWRLSIVGNQLQLIMGSAGTVYSLR